MTFSTPFTSKLYDIVSSNKPDTNLLLSSFSVHQAMLMTANGADTTTLKEFQNVLSFKSIESANQDASNMIAKLQSANDNQTLSIANALFIGHQLDIQPNFVDSIQKVFQSESRLVDFSSGETRDLINQWVEGKTNKKIKDLIPEDALSEATRIVLVNAVYFKANWLTKFHPQDTVPSVFYTDANSSISVPTMSLIDTDVYYGSNDRASWIHLPYVDNEFKMVIVLPQQRFGIDSIAPDVLSGKINWKKGYQTEISVFLPKFKYEFGIELSKVFQELGMREAFQAGGDFTKMTPSQQVFISEIFHKTFIQVDEEGTEAAAATAVCMEEECLGESLEFTVDQPFLFLIVHSATSSIIFEGKVNRPIWKE